MNKRAQDQSEYEKLIAGILSEQQTPPADLLSKIILAIARRRRARAKIKVWGFSLSLAVSFSGLILAIGELNRQIAQAGTIKILSLIFSDLSVVAANWQDFVFSLLETAPVWTAAAVLGGLLLFLVSFKYLVKNLSVADWRFNNLRFNNN